MRKNRKTTRKRTGKLEKGDQRLCLQWKRKSVFHSFLKKISSVGVNLFVLCCMVVQSWLIESSDTNLFWWYTSLFELGSVWYQHVAFFMNVSTKRLLPTYFDKISIVSIFSSTYFLFAASSLSFGLAKIDDFSIVHIFISFLNCVTKIAWDYREIHFVIVFFSNQRIPSGGSSVPGGTIWSSSSTNAHFGLPF